jgi:hypothetical protein
LNRLHDENEAPKGKNASTRIPTDTAIINEMNTNQKLHLIEILSANLVLLVRRKNLQSVTKYLTINEETLRDRGHGLVPSPNVNFGYLFPTSDYNCPGHLSLASHAPAFHLLRS